MRPAKTRGKPLGGPNWHPKILAAIVKNVRQTGFLGPAIALTGTNERTGREWYARGKGELAPGRPSTPELAEFARKVDEARAALFEEKLARIQEAAVGGVEISRTETVKYDRDGKTVIGKTVAVTKSAPDWRADSWGLERMDPGQFGQRDRVEHTGADGGPIVVTNRHLDQLFGAVYKLIERFVPEHQVEAAIDALATLVEESQGQLPTTGPKLAQITGPPTVVDGHVD